MNRSESIKELAAALSKAQGAMEGAKKDSANPFFKSKYADLASCWEACRKPLSDNGLAITQPFSSDIEKMSVTVHTTVWHLSGEWLSESVTVTLEKFDPQKMLLVVTYLRRGQLAAFVGIAPEDDDGNSTHDNGNRPHKAAPAEPQADIGAILHAAALRGSAMLDESWSQVPADQRKAFAGKLNECKAIALEMDKWGEPIKAGLNEAALADLVKQFMAVPKEHPLRNHVWAMIAAYTSENGLVWSNDKKAFVFKE